MRRILFASLATIALASATTFGVAQPPAAPFQTHQLTPTIYWVEGGGGNCGVIVGDKGVILIDAKQTLAGGKELLDDVAKISSKPITTVILTHSDSDHVGGLIAFPKGITIIAQAGDMKEQQAAMAKGGPNTPTADHLPTQVISKDKETLTIDGVKLQLLHWAPAHTSGDLVVFLPSDKIVFTGDIITGDRSRPLIHLEKNGSSEGWDTTVKGMIALDASQFVPGHGSVVDKEYLKKKLSDADAERATIKQMVAQGKSLQEIETAVGDPAPNAATPGPKFAPYSEVVYRELTNTKP